DRSPSNRYEKEAVLAASARPHNAHTASDTSNNQGKSLVSHRLGAGVQPLSITPANSIDSSAVTCYDDYVWTMAQGGSAVPNRREGTDMPSSPNSPSPLRSRVISIVLAVALPIIAPSTARSQVSRNVTLLSHMDRYSTSGYSSCWSYIHS